MTLKELKLNILNNSLTDNFFILLCQDNYFIADQYIDKLCEVRQCEVNKISALADLYDSALSLVFDYSTDINVLKTDKFSEYANNYDDFRNCIVVCKEIDKKLLDITKDYIITIPVATDWQIKEYIKTKCIDLDQQSIDWLYTITKGDLYKLTNELDKIALFSKEDQLAIVSNLKFDKLSTLYSLPIFTLTDAVMTNNKPVILEYLHHRQACNFTSIQIINTLLGNFKKLLLVKYDCGLSTTELGMSAAQYNYLSRQPNYLSEKFLTNAISFLSELDFRIKSGQFELSEEARIDYVLNKILSLFATA